MKNWRYLILSLVLSLFIHYYVIAVLMEIFGMGWYLIQFVVWCIELVVIYDALMFFTKNWNVKHRAMFFFAYYLFLITVLTLCKPTRNIIVAQKAHLSQYIYKSINFRAYLLLSKKQ